MVKNLLLMRHGTAGESPTSRDKDRELTLLGEREIRQMANWLSNTINWKPDFVACSSAVRTTLTAETVAHLLGYKNEVTAEEDLYEASVRTLLMYIHQLPGKYDNVLLVGHNPTFSYLTDYLGDKPIVGLTPGSIAFLQFTIDSWAQVEQNKGRLLHCKHPSELDV